MKQGSIIDVIDLRSLTETAKRGYLTFGRGPDNDVLLDHPSASRVHAVVQFNTKDGSAFLYDPGSTHGCFKNKIHVEQGVHVPLRVADQIRFGESTRTYILCGPSEYMPEEGPSREQRRQAAALEALKRSKERDAAAAKAQMARAISGAGAPSTEVTWGFGEDAVDVEGEGHALEDIDWRAYASTRGLTDKQQKLTEKIRKREARMQHLQNEIDRIMVKQRAMEELSAGQAATLVRNEEEIEKAALEIEELEDSLMESIRDSLGGAGGGAKKQRNAIVAHGKKRRHETDEFHGLDSDDDDTFYDRTGEPGRKMKRGRGSALKEDAEDAASLYRKLEGLRARREEIEGRLKNEVEKSGAPGNVFRNENIQSHVGAHDSLDDFMSNVDAMLESDRVSTIRTELATVDTSIAEAERLLAVADPDGYYRPGSKAAELAVRQPDQRSIEPKKPHLATQKQPIQKSKEEKKDAAQTLLCEGLSTGASVSPGIEAPRHLKGSALQEESETGGLELRRPMTKDEDQSPYEARRTHIAEALEVLKRKEKAPTVEEDAVSKVMADLDVLRHAAVGGAGHRNGPDGDGKDGQDQTHEAVWRPPQGQSGSGRTALNDKFGY